MDLFRGNVIRGAEHVSAGGKHRVFGDEARNSKIHEDGALGAVGCQSSHGFDDHVRWLDVAVNDSLCMSIIQGRGDLLKQRQSFVQRETLTLLEFFGKRIPRQIFHHDVWQSILFSIIMNHNDVGMAQLRHPNIIMIHDYGEQDGLPYIVMEYLTGDTLSEKLKKCERLSLDEGLPLLEEIAAALDYAHAQGVIHRDIKPSNVIVEPMTTLTSDRTQRAILMDFGIARFITENTMLPAGGPA